jgi:hypothetical protein
LVPDYSRFRFPLSYFDAEVFPALDAREWSAINFSWRRLGFNIAGAVVSVFVWEGTTARFDDVAGIKKVVSSLKIG